VANSGQFRADPLRRRTFRLIQRLDVDELSAHAGMPHQGGDVLRRHASGARLKMSAGRSRESAAGSTGRCRRFSGRSAFPFRVPRIESSGAVRRLRDFHSRR